MRKGRRKKKRNERNVSEKVKMDLLFFKKIYVRTLVLSNCLHVSGLEVPMLS